MVKIRYWADLEIPVGRLSSHSVCIFRQAVFEFRLNHLLGSTENERLLSRSKERTSEHHEHPPFKMTFLPTYRADSRRKAFLWTYESHSGPAHT